MGYLCVKLSARDRAKRGARYSEAGMVSRRRWRVGG
jgi:hypothetical protein